MGEASAEGARLRELAARLRCTDCKGSFGFQPVPVQRLGRAPFGLLRCGCSEFAVVDGIPVLERASVGLFSHTSALPHGQYVTHRELLQLVHAGDTDRALLKCLGFSGRAAWRVWHRDDSRLARFVARRDEHSARDVLRFFFCAGRFGSDIGDYFVHRFGQPRFIAALALLQNLAAGSEPVLDLACGVGHVAHYLTRRTTAVPVVGLDMNFDHVWIARHWVAPKADFVCANATNGLPFRDAIFVALVVSDAYHYLERRSEFIAEAGRVAPAKPLVLTRVGNRDVMPNEGSEVSLDEYLSEIGSAQTRVFSESDLVRAYLDGVDPMTSVEESPASLQRSKWLTFVRGLRAGDAAQIDRRLAHGVGRRSINPIYQQTRVDGETKLEFRFPDTWFAYENHQMLEYHLRHTQIRDEDRDALEAGRWNDALAGLLDRFVLLGLPERY